MFGVAVHYAQIYEPSDARLLQDVIALKLQFRSIGGAEGWFKAVISGVSANWLVGLAAIARATRPERAERHFCVQRGGAGFSRASPPRRLWGEGCR